MPRKQRFKPTRKPKPMIEAIERTVEQQQGHAAHDESVLAQRSEEHDSERRSE